METFATTELNLEEEKEAGGAGFSANSLDFSVGSIVIDYVFCVCFVSFDAGRRNDRATRSNANLKSGKKSSETVGCYIMRKMLLKFSFFNN